MLKTLQVSSNNIGNIGAQYFANALKNNTVNIIVFFIFIVLSFSDSKGLFQLTLSKNEITDEDAQSLADALQYNKVSFILLLSH